MKQFELLVPLMISCLLLAACASATKAAREPAKQLEKVDRRISMSSKVN